MTSDYVNMSSTVNVLLMHITLLVVGEVREQPLYGFR